jgi:hypothetical protein
MTRPMQFNDEGLIHCPLCQRNWTLTGSIEIVEDSIGGEVVDAFMEFQHPIGEVSLANYQFSGEPSVVHCPNALKTFRCRWSEVSE